MLRADTYRGLDDAINRGDVDPAEIGRRTILPASYLGGPRFYRRCYQDSMAIVRAYGRPSLFLTFTANPSSTEILRKLLPGQTASDRPDIVARVFSLQVRELLRDIKKRHIFGACRGVVWTIEYQKRGLPHLHCLTRAISRKWPSGWRHRGSADFRKLVYNQLKTVVETLTGL